MDKQQAQDIVRDTFESPFDKGRFTGFVKNLLNHIDESKSFPRPLTGLYIKESFRERIKSYDRIGRFIDTSGKVIDILTVCLYKEKSIAQARTSQRNFISGYLRGDYGSSSSKDAAIVAFYCEDTTDWRFSLVTIDHVFDEKFKVKQEFSSAKRFSFLVGENESSHTAQSRLVPILVDDKNNPTLAELEDAFNIEKVTKEFFEKYRDLFLRTKETLDEVVAGDKYIKADFEAKGVNTVDFAKKLLGQIVFLYFLQKKGWFGVAKNKNWGEGDKQFLRSLFEKAKKENKNYFNNFLEPLFYEALRNDRSHEDHYFSMLDCKIPFLNGGLFDPMDGYDWKGTEMKLSNELFSNSFKTKEGDTGNGILDIFDRYNFTVKEDEPLEKEVAVDPEMLGKAYEKFNAIRPDNFEEYKKALKSGKKGDETKFNKQYGVYYTPREIVHFMCEQSLINYLYASLNDTTVSYEKLGKEQTAMFRDMSKKSQMDLTIEHRISPVISKEDIAILIKYGEQVGENEARVEVKGRETDRYSYKIPESIRQNAALIDKKLADIKVCDPAIGSGAFPVGMMGEIVKIRKFLNSYLCHSRGGGNPECENRTPYDFKRECIEKSLYGVDIDPGAVEIAKLRLWLSLVVDEDDIKQIKPLPNLDYKIVCGNSLVGFPDNYVSVAEKEIEELIHQHFNETNPTKKNKLKELIDEKIESRYKNSLKTFGYQVNFDFKTVFSGVYRQAGGFDVMIANPPYGAALLEEQKKHLKKRHEDIVERIRNSFLYFLGEAYKQSRPTGVICFILPNELLFQIYMTKARKFFIENSQILFAVNLGEDVFDAIVPSCIICAVKGRLADYSVHVADLRNATLEELPKLLATKDFSAITNKQLLSAPNYIFSFDSAKAKLLNRLAADFEPFETFCNDIANGISTSCDEIYIVSKKFATENHFEKQYLKECIRGGQFNRFYCPDHTNEYVLYITKEFDPKAGGNIYQYLSKNKKLLIKKSVEKNHGNREWHVLFRSRYEDLFSKPKILFRQTGDRIIATVDRSTGYYCIDSVNVGNIKSEYHSLLDYFIGLLNSKLMVFYYQEISQEKGRVLAQVKPQRIRALPIAKANKKEQMAIESIVVSIQAAKKKDPNADTSALEKQIDEMVYALYGLTPEEIAIVEGKN